VIVQDVLRAASSKDMQGLTCNLGPGPIPCICVTVQDVLRAAAKEEAEKKAKQAAEEAKKRAAEAMTRLDKKIEQQQLQRLQGRWPKLRQK
jgi:hypothetical protein